MEAKEQKWPAIPDSQTAFHLGPYEGIKNFDGLRIENKTDRGVVIKVWRISKKVKSPAAGDVCIEVRELTEG